jgi:hypothetical protein
MNTLKCHLHRVLQPRFDAVPVIELLALSTLAELGLTCDVLTHLGLLLFALPVANPVLDAWMAQIQAVWRTHFHTIECYDGVVFLPRITIRLKRPVMAVFQHRHVVDARWVDNSEFGSVNRLRQPLTTHSFTDHTLLIRFYGRPRDVERMKQRTCNVLAAHASDFCVSGAFGSILAVWTRLLPNTGRSETRTCDDCLDCIQAGFMGLPEAGCPLKRTYGYPTYDYHLDAWVRRIEATRRERQRANA